MKNIFLTLLFMLSAQAFAQQSAQEVYHQLEIDFANNIHFQDENINLYRDGKTSPYIKEISPDYEFKNGRPLTSRQLTLMPAHEFLNYDVFEMAYEGYLKIKKQKLNKKNILVVVDYTLHHSKRRLFIFDMDNSKVLFNTWTQHGMGSDPQRSGYAQEFSNTSGSDQTSLGFMLTQETYHGMWGFSLRMKGIDGVLNSKVRARAVVIHGVGTLYAEAASYGSMGLSQGCITLPIYESGKFYGLEDRPLNEIIINKIKNGSVIFSYSDFEDLRTSSKWLK
jgi:hypothetical protein